MSIDRLAGRLVASYSVTLPSAPGWAQPARHREEAPGGDPSRDEAPAGGGWQPEEWGTVPGALALAGTTTGEPPSHKSAGTHRGLLGRGAGRRATALESLDRTVTGDPAGALLGAAGAAHGGIVRQGVSDPWAYPAVARRRADGGTVTRDGTLRLGRRHVHVSEEHRQGLHMNRPTIRYVREAAPTVAQERAIRAVGPVAARSRAILRPQGQTDEAPAVPANAGPIGGEWAR